VVATPAVTNAPPGSVGAFLDVAVTALDRPDPVKVGDRLLYTVTVTNTGSTAVNGVALSGSGAGVLLLPGTASQGTCVVSGRQLNCNLGTVPGGATATITASASPRVAGVVTSTFTVSSPARDPNPGNNSVSPVTTVIPQ
jgi:uncharacterized repeat protein (TIGR01451 family)